MSNYAPFKESRIYIWIENKTKRKRDEENDRQKNKMNDDEEQTKCRNQSNILSIEKHSCAIHLGIR